MGYLRSPSPSSIRLFKAPFFKRDWVDQFKAPLSKGGWGDQRGILPEFYEPEPLTTIKNSTTGMDIPPPLQPDFNIPDETF
jgi:hypothetical protein